MNNKLRAKLLKLLKDFIRLFKNKLSAFGLSKLNKTFKQLRIKKANAMQTAMANTTNSTNGGQQLATSCTSPPCTPSPCNSPINVTNLSDHSNHSIRSSPTNQITKTTLNSTLNINSSKSINTTNATSLLNQVAALGSPLSTASSLSSSPSSLASPIAIDNNVSSNDKFTTADLLLQQHAQQLNTIKNLTQAKLRNGSTGSTIKDEKNGKVSNFSIEAIMARDVENQSKPQAWRYG